MRPRLGVAAVAAVLALSGCDSGEETTGATSTTARIERAPVETAPPTAPAGLTGLDGELWATGADGSLADVYEHLAPINGFVDGTTLSLTTACIPAGLVVIDGTITEFVEGPDIGCGSAEQYAAYDVLRTLPGARVVHDDTSLTISTATGTLKFLRITDGDRTQILAMLAADRATGRNGLGTDGSYDAVYVVDTVGQVDPVHADVDFGPDSPPLTADERTAIAEALAPLPVTWVDADWIDTPTNIDRLFGEQAAVIGLAAPQLTDGQVQITSFVLCSPVCGTGSLDRLERDASDTWRIAGTPIDWEA
ncbi:MAG: hypothetical protein AAFZ07_15575 [Actinomycetota bacterium]